MRQHFFSVFGHKTQAGVLQDDVLSGLPFPAQTMNQVHGVRIAEVTRVGEPPEADALITRNRGVRLMIKTADCIPLVLADEEAGVVAAVHAGWRGLVADIVPLVFERLSAMGAAPERLKVGVGPSLGVECAIFSDPLSEIPEKYHWAARRNRGIDLIDLNAILRRQLEEGGVRGENIEWMEICTACDDKWFSWRRNKDARRFGTWVVLV